MGKLMSIKMYTRNKMKNILILALLLVFGKTAEANMVMSSFNLKGASSDNKFMVNNLHASTSVEFRFTLMKYSAPSSPGDCYVTLLYTESPENNNFDSHPSTIEISSTKYIRKSEFASHGTIYQSDWLSAILPAYRFSGKIVLRYRFFHSAQNKEVSWYSTTKYDLTIPPSTISNDNYTGAIELSSVAIEGSTEGATYSPQERPSCGDVDDFDDDVWYKFTATSTTHSITLSDVNFHNVRPYDTPLKGISLYNASLGHLVCDNINGKLTGVSLTVGQTYYVRIWSSFVKNASMTYKIALSTSGPNIITGISHGFGHVLTANYSLDSSIPVSDITFEWEVWPGEVEPAYDYSVIQGVGSHQIKIIGGPSEGDTSVRARVRMKRVSTGEPLTDWYTYSHLIWFD